MFIVFASFVDHDNCLDNSWVGVELTGYEVISSVPGLGRSEFSRFLQDYVNGASVQKLDGASMHLGARYKNSLV